MVWSVMQPMLQLRGSSFKVASSGKRPERGGIRSVAMLAGCFILALSVAGCDPLIEARYVNEGAGIDLYTSDRASQVELLNQYESFICAQVGSSCDYTTFVEAGMNDIDSRCDAFLTWLDARRRDKEPIVAELSAINTAVHTVLTVTGSSPNALNIVTTAFGLASASYTNWNSRLLIAANQSTVQEVVYKGQDEFRAKIKNHIVPNRPAAIYLLRNYLRLCMPTTIEASINRTTTLVLNDAPTAVAKSNLIVATTTPHSDTAVRTRVQFVADPAGDALFKFVFPTGDLAAPDLDHAKQVNDFITERKIGVSLATFVRGDRKEFAALRAELARRLRLIP